MPYRDRRHLPLLDGIRVSSPCPERWDDMIGDGRVRFCARCAKNVYDLSAMSRDEAEGFVREQEHEAGSVCVTLRRRRDGKVLTTDCPVGARRRRFGFAAVALVLFGVPLSFTSFTRGDPGLRSEPRSTAHAPPRAFVHHVDSLEPGGPMTRVITVSHADRGTRTTGCLCRPGDAFCSCL